jgi:hypothetical protein
LDDGTGQLDRVSWDGVVGVGPGRYIASRLLEDRGGRALLVIASKFGAGSELWLPFPPGSTQSSPLTRNTLLGSAIARFTHALAQTCEAAPLVILLNGERDARDLAIAGGYAERTRRTLTALREHTARPRLRVVVGVLPERSPGDLYPGWALVRAQQLQLCPEDAACAQIPRDSGGVHLTAAEQARAGAAIAEVALESWPELAHFRHE